MSKTVSLRASNAINARTANIISMKVMNTNEKIAAQKVLCILLYSLVKGSFRMLGKLTNTQHTQVYCWIRIFSKSLPEPEVSGDITEMEIDEMYRFVKKRRKLWVIKALDRGTRRTVVWVLGNRNAATFRRLYDKKIKL